MQADTSSNPLNSLFVPSQRLQLLFTANSFGSVVVTQARGSGGPNSVPYSDRVPYLDKTLPLAQSKLGRMQLASQDFLANEIVSIRFEPVKGFPPLIFQQWGAAWTTIDFVFFNMGGKKVLRSFEAKDIVIQQKRDRWPLYHASSDNRLFLVLTVGENASWEVKRADLLLHKNELLPLVVDPASIVPSNKLTLFRSWGQLTAVQFWGSLNIKDGKICDIVHEESMDDVIEEEMIPPIDGVIGVSLSNGICFCSAYKREGKVIELDVLEKCEVYLQHHSPNDSPKDFGKRERTVLKVHVDLELQKIDVKRMKFIV